MVISRGTIARTIYKFGRLSFKIHRFEIETRFPAGQRSNNVLPIRRRRRRRRRRCCCRRSEYIYREIPFLDQFPYYSKCNAINCSLVWLDFHNVVCRVSFARDLQVYCVLTKCSNDALHFYGTDVSASFTEGSSTRTWRVDPYPFLRRYRNMNSELLFA